MNVLTVPHTAQHPSTTCVRFCGASWRMQSKAVQDANAMHNLSAKPQTTYSVYIPAKINIWGQVCVCV